MVSLPSIILSITDAGSTEHNAIIIGQKLIRYGCGSAETKGGATQRLCEYCWKLQDWAKMNLITNKKSQSHVRKLKMTSQRL